MVLDTAGFRRRLRVAAHLLAALLLLGLLWAAIRALPAGRPAGEARSPLDRPFRTVRPGVTLADRDVGGWTEGELRSWLGRLAAQLHSPPVDARIDPATRGRVPGLAGLRLDVAATLQAALSAPEGARIEPVYRLVPPRVRLADLPPAPVYQGNPERRAVALLVNVAWGEEYLPSMLEALSKAGVRASFFLVGSWAESHARQARAIAEAGQEIDSHGWQTVEYEHLSEAEVARQVVQADRVIEAVTGRRPLFFSPHRGVVTRAVLDQALAAGHQVILWSVDTVDWQHPSPQVILERVEAKLHPGALILMHPTAETARALPELIRLVEAHGYQILPLAALLSEDPLARVR
ncbi:MAG: polysaccharide deacetylase family protein [Clostridia bacterium]|nr:polysaccharide deacetylase family protein [Clostridia bacterium]